MTRLKEIDFTRANYNDAPIGRVDSIDIAIILLIYGTVVNYSGLIGGIGGTFTRYLCFTFAAFIGMTRILRSKTTIPNEFFVLFFYLFIVFTGLAISIDKTYTFARGLNFALFSVFLVGLSSSLHEHSITRITTTLAYTYLSVIIINLFVLFLDNTSAWHQGRFQGILSHPNSIGNFCMTMYPLLLLFPRNNRLHLVVFLFGFLSTFLIHILSQSRTSLVFSLVALAVYIFLSVRKRVLFLVFSLWALSIVLLSIYIFGVPSLYSFLETWFVRGETIESLTSFTGRTTIWRMAWTQFLERPFFGYGYDVEAQALTTSTAFPNHSSYWMRTQKNLADLSLHSGYLSILVGTGLVGFITWMYLLLRPLFLVVKLPHAPTMLAFKRGFIAISIVGLLVNLFEYSITGGRNFFSIAYWILWATLITVARYPSSSQ